MRTSGPHKDLKREQCVLRDVGYTVARWRTVGFPPASECVGCDLYNRPSTYSPARSREQMLST